MATIWEWMSFIYEKWPSSSVLIACAGIFIVIGLLIYFWAWYAWPKFLVPLHLSAAELKVLEVQDQLRKTQIQIPIVISLVATFILVITQFGINSRQWTTDFELRNTQAQMNQFADAVKALTEKSVESSVAGIYALQYLVGLDTNRNIRRVTEMLTATVRSRTTEDELKYSVECNGEGVGRRSDREDGREDVQAAMNVIGNKLYSNYYTKNYDVNSRQCISRGDDQGKLTFLAYRPTLEHRYLDNLNLAERDFSCTRFSGSRFRRTSFQWSSLQGTDFRAAIFENDQVIDLHRAADSASTQAAREGRSFNAAEWVHTAPENDWKRYRCWSTFFENASLDGADFGGAQLTGAVFQNASLKDAKFGDANISLADFRGTKKYGLTAEQLKEGCIWRTDHKPLHEFGDDLEFKSCR
jgi:uncharacterized protein YjbI with pentapeptide repeats